jgi:hypothetical protein
MALLAASPRPQVLEMGQVMREMREKVLSARVRAARRQVEEGRAERGGWADTYAKDVATLRRLVVNFTIADAARGLAMDDYPGATKAEKRLFEVRLEAQRWLGANVEWHGGTQKRRKENG